MPDVDIYEEYEPEIVSALEDSANEMANEDAAMAWSTVGDVTEMELEDKYGPGEVISYASFGDAEGINGDLKTTGFGELMRGFSGIDPDVRDAIETDRGGTVPGGSETELSLEFVADRALMKLKEEKIPAKREHVEYFVQQVFGVEAARNGYVAWGSDDGDTDIWYRPE